MVLRGFCGIRGNGNMVGLSSMAHTVEYTGGPQESGTMATVLTAREIGRQPPGCKDNNSVEVFHHGT
jgi:hypothetical protein